MFGLRACVVLLLSCFIGLGPMPLAAQDLSKPKLRVPPENVLVIMIKSTLIAYNNGNWTGNYSVLRDLGSPEFSETNSVARLSEIFRDMRENGVDISPIVLFQPRMLRPPQIDEDGDLILEGFFDTRPERVNFFLVFRAVRGKWRLLAIRVDTTPVDGPDLSVDAAGSGETEPDTAISHRPNSDPAEQRSGKQDFGVTAN